MSKTVAIIGGGPSGIVAAKECLEAGLSPTLFEKAGSLGGLWRPETGGAWEGMRTNISRHTCAFSDWAWPGDAPDFPDVRAVSRYLNGYAEAFGVTPHARLNTSVTRVGRADAGWRVTADGKTESFDRVIVASGIFQTPDMPRLGGQDLFGGAIMHSMDYRSPESLKGKSVVVVGGAFSGNEISAALAANGVEVTQVVRTPVWSLTRELGETPIDLLFNTRKAQAAGGTRTAEERQRLRHEFLSSAFGNPGATHAALTINPQDPAGASVSDDYLSMLAKGRIGIRRGAAAGFDESGLVLENGARIGADAVIFCTGYRLDLPFLETGLKQAMGYEARDKVEPLLLHKETFHPAAEGLAFVGLYRGPYFGVMELQARWAAQVFGGHIAPPSPGEMHAGIAEAEEIRARRPRPQFPRNDYVGFADDLAGAIGVRPLPGRESPEIAHALENGPVIPAHFRLQGPMAKRDVALPAIQAAQARAGGRTP